MIQHCIIMSSSYSDGKRIALDITTSKFLETEDIQKTISNIKSICGNDALLSTHLLETDSKSWDSVIEKDPFFEGVELIHTEEEFSKKIAKDRVLKGLDVALYILSKQSCTHMQLQKLSYLCYADYLCATSKRLFEDKIYAFTHGPVIESVYEKYKRTQGVLDDSDTKIIEKFEQSGQPFKSRILFASDGIEKLEYIDKTLEKYGGYSASKLRNITHRPNSPWSHVDSTQQYQIITDDLISNFHYVEN